MIDKTKVVAFVAVGALGLMLSACSGSSADPQPGDDPSPADGTSDAAGDENPATTDSAFVAEVQANGVLRAAIMHNPPFERNDPTTGEWSGPQVALAYKIAEELGVELEIHDSQNPEASIAGLQSGRWDIIVDQGNTPERREVVQFTRQLFNNPTTIMTNTTYNDAMTWEEATAADQTVCLGNSVKFMGQLETLEVEAEVQQLPSQADCFTALAAGRVDATYWTWVSAGQQCREFPDTTRVLPPPHDPLADSTPGSYWGISNTFDEADVAPINAIIEDFFNDPDGWRAEVEKIEDNLDNPVNCVPDGQVPDWVREASDQMFGLAGLS